MDRDRLAFWLTVLSVALAATSVLLVLAALILLLGKAIIMVLSLLLLVGVVCWAAGPETSGKAPDGTKYGGQQ